MDANRFSRSLMALQAGIGAGTFSWGGDAWLSSINQLPGMTRLASILAETADPNQDFSNDRILKVMTAGFRVVERDEEGKHEWAVFDGWNVVAGPYSSEKEAVVAAKEHAAKHRSSAQMLAAALGEAREASPNFYSPPERGDR